MKKISPILLSLLSLTSGLSAGQIIPPARPGSAADASATLLPPEILAHTNSLPPAPDGDRFLFIVDHSTSMKKLGTAATETIVGMIFRGLDGRMTNGDTFGLWTISAKPQFGIFPMQVWDAARPLDLASMAGKYLRAVPYDGRADFGQLIVTLRSVVSAVNDVNVFLITDGNTPFKGTPVDEEVNRQLKEKGKEARRVGQTLVVTLAAREGRVVSFKVLSAAEPVSLPPRPPRIVPKPAPAPVVATPTNAHRTIVITRPAPISNAPPASPPALATPPPRVADTTPAATSAIHQPVAVQSKPAPEHPPVADPPAQLAAHHSAPPPSPAPSPVTTTPPRPPALPASTTNDAPTPPAEPGNDPPTGERIPTADSLQPPPTLRAESRPAQTPAPPTDAPTNIASAATPSHASSETSRFAALLEKKMLVFAREPASNPAAASPASPAAAATGQSWDAQVLMILGSALLVVALVLVWLVLRYQRRAPPLSAISQSMERR